MDATALVAEAHGRALRLVAFARGRHFVGLASASRACRFLPNKLQKKLVALDSAFAVTRHITRPSLESFVRELEEALGMHSAVQPKVEHHDLASDDEPPFPIED